MAKSLCPNTLQPSILSATIDNGHYRRWSKGRTRRRKPLCPNTLEIGIGPAFGTNPPSGGHRSRGPSQPLAIPGPCTTTDRARAGGLFRATAGLGLGSGLGGPGPRWWIYFVRGCIFRLCTV